MNLNLRQISSKLSTRGWIAVGAAALIGILFIFLLMTVASAPSYTTLVAGDSPAQAQKVTTALATAQIPYRLSPSGTAVSVPSSQAGQASDVLATAGLSVGNSGQSLESLIGKQSLGESNLEQDEQAQSAEEQQLDQTIEQMNGVTGAAVTLGIPNQADELFTGATTPTTASVLLDTSSTLQSGTVKSIAETVANAVPGLNVDKVSITDQYGDQLWPSAGNGQSNGLTAKQSAQDAYNDQQAEAVDAALAATLGPNKAMVLINADLNMNRQSVDSVTYGRRTTPLTSTSGKQKLSGAGLSPGAAGNNATKLATLAGTAKSGTSKYSNNTLTTQNGVNKTVSQAVIAPGEINRQTVSVLVNSTVPARLDRTIESLVKGAVGFKPRRDKITIGTLPFQRVKPLAATASKSKLGDLKYVAVVIGSLLFLALIARALRKRERDEFAGDPTWLRELELPRPLSELEAQAGLSGAPAGELDPPTAVARLRSPVSLARQQIEELVDRDPERVASQIRQWMTED